MKQLTAYLLPLLLLLLAASCKKDKVPPLEQLPAATQEGKGTFGCLVDGKAFTPKGPLFGGPTLTCFYQHLNSNSSKGYFFGLSAANKKDKPLISIGIFTDSLKIEQSKTYELKLFHMNGAASAIYSIGLEEYTIAPPLSGELTITHFDEEKQIVSGTFWFDAVNKEGEKVEVREGRFDMLYSK